MILKGVAGCLKGVHFTNKSLIWRTMASLISFQARRCYLSWGYLCVYNWYHDLTFDDCEMWHLMTFGDTWIKVMWAQQKRERPWSRCWEPLDLSCRSMKKIFNNFAPIESPFGSFSYKYLLRMPFANFAGGQIYNVSFFCKFTKKNENKVALLLGWRLPRCLHHLSCLRHPWHCLHPRHPRERCE